MNREELIDKIRRIDENAYFSGAVRPGARASVVVVGASALLLCDVSHKGATRDVDILHVEQSIRETMFSDPDFNGRCNAFSQCLPYNYEDRLNKVDLDTYVIDIWVPSLEDLAVMKLYRWEDPDKEDLTSDEFLARLDWGLLDHLVHSPEEAQASRSAEPANDRELRNLRFNYSEYEKGYRKCD